MTEENASSAERQGEPPAWQPPGWEVPAPDPSVPPYAAPPGWQPPVAAPPPPYAAPVEWGSAAGPSGWHGVAPGAGGGPPGYPPPPAHAVSPHSVGGYPQPYGYQPYGGYPRPRDTNGFAIASLVCSLLGIVLVFVGPLLGLIFGLVALRQLERSRAGGRGLAIAGMIVGGVVLVLNIAVLVAIGTGHGSSDPGGLTTLYPVTAMRSSA